MKRPNGISSIISDGSFIDGSLSFPGVIMISGTVKGPSLSTTSSVDITKKKRDDAIIVRDGKIIAEQVNTNSFYLESGKLECAELRAERNLFIGSGAVVKGGTLYYGESLEIEDGAVLDGCQVKHLNFCSEGEIT